MFLWAEVVATACYTKNRSLIHTRHCKTPYELVHDKKPDLTFSESLVLFATLQMTANILENYNQQLILEYSLLTEQMALVQLSTGPAPTFLTPGQISSGLVPNPVHAAPYIPPKNKDLEILFQPMFNEYLEPPHVERPVSPAPTVQVPVNSTGTPSSTTIDQDAPSLSHSPSSSALQSPSLHQGVAAESPLIEDNPFSPIDNDHFINVFAPEPRSETSSYGDLSSTESPYVSQTLHHLGKWSKDHPLDNIIGNPSRPVSTKKQLATDALWCLYNSVLLKVEPKNFKSAIIEDFKLDEYDDVLKNKARLVAKGYRQEEGIDFEESFALAPHLAREKSSSSDSSPVHSLGLDASDQAHSGSSTRDVSPRLCYPQRRAPQCSEAFHHWCAAPLSTWYPPTTSESSSGDSSGRPMHLSSHSAGPSRKRCRSSVDSVPLSTPVTGSLAPTHAYHLPPRKRFRDSYSSEASLEEDAEDIRPMVRSRTMTNTHSGMTHAAIEEMVDQRVNAALEAHQVNQNLKLGNDNGNGNGNDNGNGNGNDNENGRGDRLVARECTYQDFMKCQPTSFKGTKGV
ncbi:hypothetical protein Tco_1231339, partial [Tanacetum coccineum]